MGFLESFFEIFMWFDSVFFLYVVEAIIYGGIFRSNCENFESKDDRNREERIFFVTFWVFFFSQTRSHLFSNDVVVQIFFFLFPLVFLIRFFFFSKNSKTRGTWNLGFKA